MFEQDTICGVSTPAGHGGIGVIRISGRDAISFAGKIARPRNSTLVLANSHSIHYGHVVDPANGEIVDEVLVSVMRGPSTYTREDVVEINCHGGAAALQRTMRLLVATGVRQAEPGEFTKRAFLNGRIDLAQAEAVMDIIRARTEVSLRAANEQLAGGLSKDINALRDRMISVLAGVEAGVDFPEEDIEMPSGKPLADEVLAILKSVDGLLNECVYGKVVREGVAMAIVGRPNVGKSSLLNALLRQDRAIVTDLPGTTRDVLEESININGMLLRILDTAGIRHTKDLIEQEGVRRSRQAIQSADIILVVLDGSERMTQEDRAVIEEAREKPVIAVINKSDLPQRIGSEGLPEAKISISCKTGGGLDRLKQEIWGLMEKGAIAPREHAWAVNQRHATALEAAKESLEKALASAQHQASPELIAVDLRDALDSIGLIVGATYTEDILDRIFHDFCIGK